MNLALSMYNTHMLTTEFKCIREEVRPTHLKTFSTGQDILEVKRSMRTIKVVMQPLCQSQLHN